jgi:hypothetical protein
LALSKQSNTLNLEDKARQLDSTKSSSAPFEITAGEEMDSLRKAARIKFNDSVNNLNLTFPIMDSAGEIIGNLGYGTEDGKTVVRIPNGVTKANVDSAINLRKKIKGKNYKFSDKISDYMLKYFADKKAKNPGEVNLLKAVEKEFVQTLPKSFFILMPFFAFMLWLLYNKKYYFFYHHMVFTIHYYCVSFIVYSIAIFLSVNTSLDLTAILLAFAGMSLYLLFAIKKFYKQSWGKTGFKFFIHGMANTLAIFMALLIIILIGLMHA